MERVLTSFTLNLSLITDAVGGVSQGKILLVAARTLSYYCPIEQSMKSIWLITVLHQIKLWGRCMTQRTENKIWYLPHLESLLQTQSKSMMTESCYGYVSKGTVAKLWYNASLLYHNFRFHLPGFLQLAGEAFNS